MSEKATFIFDDSTPMPMMADQPEEREPVTRAPNLIELTQAYQIGMDMVEHDAEDMADEMFESLAGTEEALHNKLANYGVAIKIHKAEAEAFKAQAGILKSAVAELEHKAKMVENQAARKRERLHAVMKNFGIRSAKNAHATVTVKTLFPTLYIANEEIAIRELPAKFLVTTHRIDKKALLDALLDGTIDDSSVASLTTDKTTIQVR